MRLHPQWPPVLAFGPPDILQTSIIEIHAKPPSDVLILSGMLLSACCEDESLAGASCGSKRSIAQIAFAFSEAVHKNPVIEKGAVSKSSPQLKTYWNVVHAWQTQ